MTGASGGLRSVVFRREREATWRELEALLGRVERGGLTRLTAAEATRLPVLHRAVMSSLSVARAISLDLNLQHYLEDLAARSFLVVYAAKRPVAQVVSAFLRRGLPDAVARIRPWLAVATVCLLAGVAAGFVLTAQDPTRFDAFVPASLAAGRSATSTTGELRRVLVSGNDDSASSLLFFATFLFTHNARIAMLAFALGFAAGLPAALLLLWNGAILGAFGGLYQRHGLGAEFWAWVLPHGITELGAIVLAGAAGLAVGATLVFPGRGTRLAELAREGRSAATIVVGAVAMLALAGLIEGVFRQLVIDTATRYALAAATLVGWVAYFGRTRDAHASAGGVPG